jgi:hypothetical protein
VTDSVSVVVCQPKVPLHPAMVVEALQFYKNQLECSFCLKYDGDHVK